MKKAIRILSVVMIIALLQTVTFANEFNIGVAFDSENSYEIYGSTGSTDETVQVIRNYYKNGVFEKSEYGNLYTIGANQDFTFSEPFDNDNETSVEVFLVDSEDKAVANKYIYSKAKFEYTLENDCSTSAGVYDEKGKLIRTLWGGKKETAGAKTEVWDGKDDYGNYMESGNYTVKILSSNVNYEMDALVGNNTKYESLLSNMSNYYPMSDMTYANGKMYYAEQYTETSTMWRHFDVSDPHKGSGYITGQNKTSMRCTTDGEMVYWLNFQPLATTNTGDEIPRMFVAALDVASNKETVFENGTPLWRSKIGTPVKRFESAIGIEEYSEYSSIYGNGDGMATFKAYTAESFFGDIAATKENPYIAVTLPRRDYVKILHKYTGAELKQNEITSPTMLTYDETGNLWVVSNVSSDLSCYTIDETGTMTKLKSAPQSAILDEILGMEISPSGSTMVLVYGGTTNKVVAYNLSDWSLKWSFGSGESYTESPEIKEDKLLFRGEYEGRDYSYVAFENENTLWFGEPGNRRNYKLDLSSGIPVIADNIQMSAVEYLVSVDINNPTRVFGGHIEYEIDYAKDGDSCWQLKNNWLFFTRPYLESKSTSSFIDSITTLQNGGTYFLGRSKETNLQYVYELTESGIRNTGIEAEGYTMLYDGKCTLQATKYTEADSKKVQGIFKRYVTGFDGVNPIYSDDIFIGYVSKDNLGTYTLEYPPAVREDGFTAFVDSRGNVPESHITDERVGMRLAATYLQPSYDDFEWEWKTARATSANYKGVFPRDGAFEINAWYTTKYGPKFYDKNIIMQYHGEGYNGGQCNIFYHFYDNGLLVGVYGDAMYQQSKYEDYGQDLVNGNGFNWQMIQSPIDPSVYYIYQAGEARLTGFIRTKVTGLDTIEEQSVDIIYKSSLVNSAVLSEYRTVDFVSTNADKSLVSGFKCNVTSGYANLSGYIKKPDDAADKLKLWFYTDGEAEITVEDELVMSGSQAGYAEIELENNRYYYISADIKGSSFRVLYEKSDGSKVDFPADCVFSEERYNNVKVSELNLLDNVSYKATDKSTIEGWNFSIDDSLTHTVKTNVYNYDITEANDLDISVTTKKDTSYEITRDLGEIESFADIWEIDANMIYLGYPTGEYSKYYGNVERYMDILDGDGKIIARFYVSNKDYSPYGNDIKICSLEIPKDYTALDRRYLHELSVPFDLKIVGTDGKISFMFNQNTVVADVFESGADWKSPKTLRLSVSQTANASLNTEYIFKYLGYNQYSSDYVRTVEFYDENGRLISVAKAKKNTTVKPPVYEKAGSIVTWDKDLSCVTEDMKVSAIVTKDTTAYNVNFFDESGALIETKGAPYGIEITSPAVEKNGYRLVWQTEDGKKPDFINRTEDINVYARYEKVRSIEENFGDFLITAPTYSSSGAKIKSGSITSSSGMTYYANDQAYKVMSMEDDCLFMEGQNISVYSPNDFRIYFDSFESGKVTVGFRFKALNYTGVASYYDFGSLYDSNGRCIAKLGTGGYGLYVYDGKILDDLITKDTRNWHNIEYNIDLEANKYSLIFDGVNMGEYDFYDSLAENVNSLYFAGANTSAVSANAMNWYMNKVYAKN